MATEKPRYMITVEEELLDEIEKYRYENKIATRSRATVELLRKGVEELEKEEEPTSNEQFSLEEEGFIKKYRQLDQRGQAAVQDTLNREYGFAQRNDEKPQKTKTIRIAASGAKPGESIRNIEITEEEEKRILEYVKNNPNN